MISFANPTNSGVANSSSMIVPCIVNSSLYCWSDTTWFSGSKSWSRMIMAISPPAMKNPNDVIRYRCPMILWSVEDSQSAMTEPLRTLRGAVTGRVDCCSSVVTERSLLPCAAMPAAHLSTGGTGPG